MPTTTSTTSERRTATKVQPEQGSRGADMAGAVLLATGLIVLIALTLGNAGLVGNSLATLFRMMFGNGAWAIPFASTGLGVAMILGRRGVDVSRVTWGMLLVFLAVVGLFSGTLNGDYFDPEAAMTTGGYLGAVLGWTFETLLGSAKPIGLSLVAIIGVIFCLDAPLRIVVKDLAGRTKRRVKDKKIQPSPTAAVKMPQGGPGRGASDTVSTVSVQPEETKQPDVSGETQEAKPRPKPKITEGNDTPSLATEDPTPRGGYELPSLGLLKQIGVEHGRSQNALEKEIHILERTFEEFGIDGHVLAVAAGPTVTRFEIQLGPGIRVNKITALADNIAMSLAAPSVRVEAPIPGKSAVGIEIPNKGRTTVTLRELCESLEFHDNKSKLMVALGKDVTGENKYADLTRMPHLLIGGATNSGKSICLATLIMSLIMRNTPKDLRMVMIDPKRVELTLFEGLPHLMCPVVKDVKEAPGVLRAVWREMDRRYDMFSEKGVRNIDGWNEKAEEGEELPYIVVVVDELADLMMQAAAEVETAICRLAQLARATGIHLVLATQRPSVDVITGTIKANISSRIAFSVSSQIDSRTILDSAGAEKLIGKGDMLFLPIDANKPTRVQGCFITESEIETVAHHWRSQEKPHYVLNPVDIAVQERESEMREMEDDEDEHWEEAVRWVADRGQASTSMLQRKFSIGFQRASRLLDMMEERNIVGERDGPRPRKVLIDPMQVETILGNQEMMEPMPEDAYIDEDKDEA